MIVKFKLIHENAKLPKQRLGYMGWDIAAIEAGEIFPSETGMINTGLVLSDTPYNRSNSSLSMIKIEGKFGLASSGIFPISGIIDPYYREEIKVLLYNSSVKAFAYEPGDVIAKFVCYPAHPSGSGGKIVIVESNSINKT